MSSTCCASNAIVVKFIDEPSDRLVATLQIETAPTKKLLAHIASTLGPLIAADTGNAVVSFSSADASVGVHYKHVGK